MSYVKETYITCKRDSSVMCVFVQRICVCNAKNSCFSKVDSVIAPHYTHTHTHTHIHTQDELESIQQEAIQLKNLLKVFITFWILVGLLCVYSGGLIKYILCKKESVIGILLIFIFFGIVVGIIGLFVRACVFICVYVYIYVYVYVCIYALNYTCRNAMDS